MGLVPIIRTQIRSTNTIHTHTHTQPKLFIFHNDEILLDEKIGPTRDEAEMVERVGKRYFMALLKSVIFSPSFLFDVASFDVMLLATHSVIQYAHAFTILSPWGLLWIHEHLSNKSSSKKIESRSKLLEIGIYVFDASYLKSFMKQSENFSFMATVVFCVFE